MRPLKQAFYLLKNGAIYQQFYITVLASIPHDLDLFLIIQRIGTDCQFDWIKKPAFLSSHLCVVYPPKKRLDFKYLNDKGESVNRSAFSAGEKQLLVIAMLWGLGICSRKQLPIIIDTPLARLDNTHRKALINNYFPKASAQTILLSTDSEVQGSYYDMLRPYIDRAYTLIFNDDERRSEIQKGYFGGEL